MLEQAEAAGETLKALSSRREEVDAIGPERLAAIRRGDEVRPQYLREPARLFSKKAPPAADVVAKPSAPATDTETPKSPVAKTLADGPKIFAATDIP